MGTLHIYAQTMWHDEAYIAGTREDLEMLRIAIDHALAEGNGQMQAFACDGEGYTVHIVPMSEDQADEMPVPYTHDQAKAKHERMKYGPWALLRSNSELDRRLDLSKD